MAPTGTLRNQSLVNTHIDPTDSDAEIVQNVYAWFRSAKAARAPMLGTWRRCYNTLRASMPAPSSGPSLRVPELFRLVRSSVGWKMDQRILTEVSPIAPLGSQWYSFLNERCRDMEIVMESTHWANHEEIETERMLWNADTYGTGWLKTCWHADLAGGLGDSKINNVNPFCIYPDPAATNPDEMDFIIEARAMSVQELDRRFPGTAQKFANGDIGESIDEPPNQLSATGSNVPRPIGLPSRPVPGRVAPGNTPTWSATGSNSPFSRTHQDPIVVLECWVREHYTKGGTTHDGWRVLVVAGQHLLLNEKATDIMPFDWHPYDRYIPHDLGEMWGIGLVELLGPIQAAYNRILRSVQQNVELTGNPILLEDAGALTQGAGISSTRPGSRMTKRGQNKEVKWMEPPHLHPSIGDLIQFLLDRMQAVSGLNDIGGNPKGRPAAETAGMIQEAQFVAIRSQLINLEHALQGAYRKKVALISQNYTEPRWINVTGPDGADTPKMLTARHFMRPTPDGGVPLEYNIKVDAGSAEHTSRKVRQDNVITMFTLGLIDDLTAMEMLDVPNPAMIMERKKLQAQSILATQPPGTRQRARA